MPSACRPAASLAVIGSTGIGTCLDQNLDPALVAALSDIAVSAAPQLARRKQIGTDRDFFLRDLVPNDGFERAVGMRAAAIGIDLVGKAQNGAVFERHPPTYDPIAKGENSRDRP